MPEKQRRGKGNVFLHVCVKKSGESLGARESSHAQWSDGLTSSIASSSGTSCTSQGTHQIWVSQKLIRKLTPPPDRVLLVDDLHRLVGRFARAKMALSGRRVLVEILTVLHCAGVSPGQRRQMVQYQSQKWRLSRVLNPCHIC